MIEKLNVAYIQVESDGNAKLELSNKINELCDAVNELQLTVSKMENLEHLKKIGQGFKNPQDPYAEQRKWIGKLCWFWDDEKEEKVCGILTTIDSDCGLSDMCPYWNGTTSNWFEHCEPVSPDDDIIYKGGDNDDR